MVYALLVSNLILWAVLIALTLVVLALVRQIGVLHERIAPAGALLLERGLKVGEAAPVVSVVDLNGHGRSIGAASEDGRTTLIVFVSPTCPVCKALLPVVKASRRSEHQWLEVILASDGPDEEQRRFVASHGLTEIPYVLSAPLGMAYQVGRLPFAALIDPAGILRARGLVNSREHLESLFEAQRRGVASLQQFFESRADSQAA
ncbi:MAG TPA: methylamine dehydrogenase accessory protein MauD [Steroidobacteraceae bacterium]|nr:methylamine dehydrogenase accessory protein MauD [Steroidobacteraceae bacterium]